MCDPVRADASRREFLDREESSRRNYILGRWGRDAVLDDPHWTHYDNDKCAPLSLHRSPYGLDLADIGMAEYRRAQAGGWKPSTSKSALHIDSRADEGLEDQRAKLPPKSAMSRSCFSAGSNKDVSFFNASPPKTGGSVAAGDRGISSRLSANALPGRNLIASTPASLRSHASRKSIRSKIGEAIERELSRSALGDSIQAAESKRLLPRSVLEDYIQAAESKKQRERQKQLDMPLHLRTGENPVSNGCPPNNTTEQMRALNLPIQMATDPKWSTELKKMNGKIGLRLEWERKIGASVTGQLVPELKHMPPKTHVSNPPTPYFVPGQAHRSR